MFDTRAKEKRSSAATSRWTNFVQMQRETESVNACVGTNQVEMKN